MALRDPKKTRPDQIGRASNLGKDPRRWVTGDQPMTDAQSSYLMTLAEHTNRMYNPDLSKAQAAAIIDRLQTDTGIGVGSRSFRGQTVPISDDELDQLMPPIGEGEGAGIVARPDEILDFEQSPPGHGWEPEPTPVEEAEVGEYEDEHTPPEQRLARPERGEEPVRPAERRATGRRRERERRVVSQRADETPILERREVRQRAVNPVVSRGGEPGQPGGGRRERAAGGAPPREREAPRRQIHGRARPEQRREGAEPGLQDNFSPAELENGHTPV